MGLVQCRSPKTGIVYVYESKRYFDEESGKYRYKRKCVGKIDDSTGEMVPTGPRGGYRPKGSGVNPNPGPSPRKPGRPRTKSPSEEYAGILAQIEELKADNFALQKRAMAAEEENKALQTKLARIQKKVAELAAMV